MITHNMQSALELGNRTIMMDRGRIVMSASGEDRKISHGLRPSADIQGSVRQRPRQRQNVADIIVEDLMPNI